MCGLVAILGRVPQEAVQRAARDAGRRGPHSHGVLSLAGGELQRRTGSGPLKSLPTGEVVLGHSRLATFTAAPGALPNPNEGQPLIGVRYALAHNGNFPELRHGETREPADSWGLLRHVETYGPESLGDLNPSRPQAALVLDLQDAQLTVWRAAPSRWQPHPLFLTMYPAGLVVSSHPLTPKSTPAPVGVTQKEITA